MREMRENMNCAKNFYIYSMYFTTGLSKAYCLLEEHVNQHETGNKRCYKIIKYILWKVILVGSCLVNRF